MTNVNVFGINPSQLTLETQDLIVQSGLDATVDVANRNALNMSWQSCRDDPERRNAFWQGQGRDIFAEYWRLRFIEQADALARSVGEPLRQSAKPSPRVVKSRFGRVLLGTGLLASHENDVPRADRLRISLILVILGFTLVIANYFLIPTLAGGLLEVATSGLDRTAKDLQSKIDASYSRQTEQGTQDSIDNAKREAANLRVEVGSLMAKMQSLETPAAKVVKAIEDLMAINSRSKLYEAAQAFAPVKKDGQEPATDSDAVAHMKAVADHLKSTRGPDLLNARDIDSMLLKVINGGSAFTRSEKDAANTLRVAHRQNTSDRRIYFVSSTGFESRPDMSLIAASLSKELEELRKSEMALSEAMVQAESGLKAAFAKVSADADGAATSAIALQSTLNESTTRIQMLITELDNRTRLITEREDLTASMIKSFDDIRAIASNNANLSSFTAGPAVFVVLAIAAMFVTVGIQSLLRWAKSGDDEVAEAQARERMRALTETYARMHLLGIPAQSHLENMQALLPLYDRRAGSVSLPTVRTLAELVKTVKNG